MKQTIHLTESELKGMIRECLKEYIDPEGSLDNPNNGDPFGDYRDEIVADYNGDEKAAENDYSWNEFDTSRYPSINPYRKTSKAMASVDSDAAMEFNNYKNDWTPRQLCSADKMKQRWVNGERSLDDMDDAFYGSSLDEAITRAMKKVLI